MFVSWFDIEQYSLAFDSEKKKKKFAEWLWKNRNNDNIPSDREEPGKYLWWLWNKGATLEAINWYVEERKKYNDHGQMAAEFPSDDVEAFVHSGQRVFDKSRSRFSRSQSAHLAMWVMCTARVMRARKP